MKSNKKEIYAYRTGQIKLGTFLTPKKTMDYKVSEIFNQAKKIYEDEYQNRDNKQFDFLQQIKINDYSSFNEVYGVKSEVGIRTQKQTISDHKYLIHQNIDEKKNVIRVLFHKYDDYDIGFVSSLDSLNNGYLLPGFLLVDKLNWNIYFLLASKSRNSSIFLDNRSLTRLFILDNNLFPVASLTYNEGEFFYKSVCVYKAGTDSIVSETILLSNQAEDHLKNIDSMSTIDLYNYLSYKGIPLGDVNYNIPNFMRSRPLWLMGSLIEYKFNTTNK